MMQMMLVSVIVVAACSKSHPPVACETSDVLRPADVDLLPRSDASADVKGVTVFLMPNGELIVSGTAVGAGLMSLEDQLDLRKPGKAGVLLVVAPSTTWSRLVDVVGAIEHAGTHRVGFMFDAQPNCPGVVWTQIDDRARAVSHGANATWGEVGAKLPEGTMHLAVE